MVDKELVPTTNDDKQGQVDYHGRAHGRRCGQGRGGSICQPHRANGGTCISSISTMEEEGSFM